MNSRRKNPMASTVAVYVVALLSAAGFLAMRCNGTPTTQTFTFFLHDNLLTGPTSSADVLLPPELTLNPAIDLTSFYGTLVVFDDSMTTGPSPAPSLNSIEIGRGRGLYLFDAKDANGAAIEFIWTAQFNQASGYGSGTTLSFLGFDRTTDASREISIVGGTGNFRFARGWAVITTYSLIGAAAVLNITATFTYGS